MPDIRDIKAKSEKYGGENLTEHTVQVVRRMAQLKARLPNLPDELNVPDWWGVLFWTAWFHDFGKAASGFQEMLSGGPKWEYRHEILSLAFLDWVFSPNSDAYALATSAIAAHHRDFRIIEQQYIIPILDGNLEDAQIEQRWSQEMQLWRIGSLAAWTISAADRVAAELGFDISPYQLQDVNVEQTINTGPDRIYHALQTYQNYFDRQKPSRRNRNKGTALRHEALCLRGLILQADRLASADAPDLRIPNVSGVRAELPAYHTWYQHQKNASETTGNALLAAPTGSGKTEAALLWAQKQITHDNPGALFYLLPFQASINAMHRRIYQRYHVPQNQVALMHSTAVQAIYRDLIAEANETVNSATQKARRQKSLGRLHQQPICIATPYQLLRAAYRLPGYEGQWIMLHGAHLVVDEIHGYEPVRLGLLLELFATLKRDWNARFFCMTATMPTWLRSLIKEVLDINHSNVLKADNVLYLRLRRHHLFVKPGTINDEETLEAICQKVKAGKNVLVVANLVDTAQELAKALQHRLGEVKPGKQVLLLHSRFTREDRLQRERALMKRINKPSKKGFVAVGTQVVEVSLDVDFDTIYTEPAPLEALLQRFGRVNRKSHPKDIKPVHVMKEAVSWKYPYDQEDLMRRTMELLLRHDKDILDESVLTNWLDEIYEPEVETLKTEIEKGRLSFQEACGPERLIAFNSDPDIRNQFNDLFDGYEILPSPCYEKFISRVEEGRIIEAYSLLAPISKRRFHALNANQQVQWMSDHCIFKAECSYTATEGMTFDIQTGAISTMY